MINRPPSNLKPLDSEECREVAGHILVAIQNMDKHRHNSRSDPKGCGQCLAASHLIRAFRIFKRNGA